MALEASSLYGTPTDAQTECIIADAYLGNSKMVNDVPPDELLGENPELSSEIIFQIDDEIEEITPGVIIEEPIEIKEFKEPENLPLPEHLTKSGGVFYGPTAKETYYNLNMSRCVDIMKSLGYDYEVWVRDDGVKMYGYYVMIAANTYVNPKGTIIDTSLGKGIVVDHCVAAERFNVIDIAVTW